MATDNADIVWTTLSEQYTASDRSMIMSPIVSMCITHFVQFCVKYGVDAYDAETMLGATPFATPGHTIPTKLESLSEQINTHWQPTLADVARDLVVQGFSIVTLIDQKHANADTWYTQLNVARCVGKKLRDTSSLQTTTAAVPKNEPVKSSAPSSSVQHANATVSAPEILHENTHNKRDCYDIRGHILRRLDSMMFVVSYGINRLTGDRIFSVKNNNDENVDCYVVYDPTSFPTTGQPISIVRRALPDVIRSDRCRTASAQALMNSIAPAAVITNNDVDIPDDVPSIQAATSQTAATLKEMAHENGTMHRMAVQKHATVMAFEDKQDEENTNKTKKLKMVDTRLVSNFFPMPEYVPPVTLQFDTLTLPPGQNIVPLSMPGIKDTSVETVKMFELAILKAFGLHPVMINDGLHNVTADVMKTATDNRDMHVAPFQTIICQLLFSIINGERHLFVTNPEKAADVVFKPRPPPRHVIGDLMAGYDKGLISVSTASTQLLQHLGVYEVDSDFKPIEACSALETKVRIDKTKQEIKNMKDATALAEQQFLLNKKTAETTAQTMAASPENTSNSPPSKKSEKRKEKDTSSDELEPDDEKQSDEENEMDVEQHTKSTAVAKTKKINKSKPS